MTSDYGCQKSLVIISCCIDLKTLGENSPLFFHATRFFKLSGSKCFKLKSDYLTGPVRDQTLDPRLRLQSWAYGQILDLFLPL